MDLYLKQLLLLAENKYTDLLKKILENKSNLNVILDKKTNLDYVYNSNKEYQNMDKSEIANLSMEKLYNQLNKIKDAVKNINEESLKIEDKYKDKNWNECVSSSIFSGVYEGKYRFFINNKNTQKEIEECITNIFDSKKDEAHEVFNNYIKIEGY
jgi:transcriptional regulator with PAS, ATPase and Fis domain